MVGGYAGGPAALQPRHGAPIIAPYSQQLGDFFALCLSVLVKGTADIYSAALGMTDLPGTKSRESLS
jgi:hypothetical protein